MDGELIPTLVRARLHLESLIASNAVWPGGLEDTWSEAVQDLQLPDDVLDSLQLADWDDLLGTLHLGGLDDPGSL